ncbi:MAG TPA: hypothetical protein VFE62_16280 [Gemmataceae bacterium]|nr:hypothetical protein [Gemmataceae bacterium]
MTRKRRWTLLLCLLAGCSTHPLVDTCDFFQPGKLYKTTVTPYGGVAIPQGPIIPAAPNIGVGPPAAIPTGPLIPPPAPLPGNRPGVQLQTPTPGPEFPPQPPPPPKM